MGHWYSCKKRLGRMKGTRVDGNKESIEWDYLFVNGVTINSRPPKEKERRKEQFYGMGQLRLVCSEEWNKLCKSSNERRSWNSNPQNILLPFIKPPIQGGVSPPFGYGNLICQGCKKRLASLVFFLRWQNSISSGI